MNEPDQAPAQINGDALGAFPAYADLSGAEGISLARGGADLVSLPFIAASIRRRKRLPGIAAALGLLVGCALFFTIQTAYRASVSVLIMNAPGSDQTTSIETDVLLAKDPAVAAAVVKNLGLRMSASSFLATYSVASSNYEVLNIESNAPTASLATREAVAIAHAFLTFRANVLQGQEGAVMRGIENQLIRDRGLVVSLRQQVSGISARRASARTKARLSQLEAQLARARSAVPAMEWQATINHAAMQATVAVMVNGSRVMYASSASLLHPRQKAAVEYAGGGLLGGFLSGLLIVVVGAVTSTRLRSRGDIAEALGAPVPVCLDTPGLGRATAADPGKGRQAADVSRAVRYLRGVLRASPAARPVTLSVVAVDNAREVAALVAALAVSLAREGNSVAIADLANGTLAGQLGVGAAGIARAKIGQAPVTVVLPDSAGDLPRGPLRRDPHTGGEQGIDAVYAAADFFLTMAVLSPARGGDHLGTWSGSAVAVITAGESTAAMVQSVGEMIRFAGVELPGAILLGGDPDDDSLGHSSRNGRAGSPASSSRVSYS